MLVHYPKINNGNSISYNVTNAVAVPITGDPLYSARNSGYCNGYPVTTWVETCATYNCTLGAGCTGSGDGGSWTDSYEVCEGAWVTNCQQADAITDADGPNGGGGGGGGDNTNNNDDDNDNNNDDENCAIVDADGNCMDNNVAVIPFDGDNSNSNNNTDPSVDICNEQEKINNLIENAPTNYQQFLQSIAGFADENFEVSATIDVQNQAVLQQGTQGSGGTNINPNPANAYESITHTHDAFGIDPDGDGIGTGTYSVFSFEDLKLMAKILYNNKLNSGTFVAFLITEKGTRYALTINNPTKFLDLFYYKIIDIPSTPEEVGKWTQSKENLEPLIEEYYDKKNPDRKIKESDTDNENVLKEFLNFLNEGDAGISLFEANTDFSNFQPLKLSLLGGDVDRTTNCNN